MQLFLKILFGSIFCAMVWVTTWAGLQQNIFEASQVWTDPWSRATLFDAYFGFITFFVWVAYKERKLILKVIWFVLIMGFGNLAMSSYVLIQLFKLTPNEPWHAIFSNKS